MNFERAEHLDLIEKYQVTIEGDCNDADYITDVEIVDDIDVDFYAFLFANLGNSIDDLEYPEYSDSEEQDELRDSFMDAMPRNPSDGGETRLSSINIVYFDDEGEAYKVTL